MSRPDIAIVTGAAGGIGEALCARLERDGFRVIGIDRAVSDRPGSLVLDMNDTHALAALGKQIQSADVRVIVHNAAVQPIAGAGQTPLPDWFEALRVNVVAVDALVSAFSDGLAANKGAVVVISSVHARATTEGINAYATTKAALEGWVRSACLDLGPEIRVNAISPGAIDTPKLREGFLRWGLESSEERIAELCRRTALGRIGRAEEVADLAAFLVSPQASFITGTTMMIDGGASARLGSE